MSDRLTNAVEMVSGSIDDTAEALSSSLGAFDALGHLSKELRNGTADMAEAIRELAAAVREAGGCRCK